MVNYDGTSQIIQQNRWVMPSGYGPGSYFPNSSISPTSDTPLFGDGLVAEGAPVPESWELPGPSLSTGFSTGVWSWNMMSRFITLRHGPSTNFVFADGHAEGVPLANVWNLNWQPNWQSHRRLGGCSRDIAVEETPN